MKFIANDLLQKLYEAEVLTTDPRYIRRVVIDIPAGGVCRVLVEQFADNDKVTPEVVGDIILQIEQRDPDDTQIGWTPEGAELHAV